MEGFQEATAGLKTEFEVITRNSKGEQYYCPGDVISSQGTNVAAEIRIVDNNNGRYVISFIPSQAGQHTLTIQVNGESIKEFLPICIKERSFTPVSFIGEGCFDNTNLKRPWGVAVNDSNEILVTDKRNNRVVVLNDNGEFMRSFGQNLVNLPTGICINKEGRIFVANRGNNKVLLFSPDGEYVTEVHEGGLLSEPRGISINREGNLTVCDAGKKCVKFISLFPDAYGKF